jgi:hypothetical protein
MQRRILTVLCSMIFSLAVFSQTKAERKVLQVTEELRKAMIGGNKSELERLTSDKLSYGHSGGHVEGKQEFVDKIVSGKSDFVTIDISDQTISISGKTAVVRHKFNSTTNDNGKPGEVHLLVLLIWHKEKGDWKLLARQAVKVQ